MVHLTSPFSLHSGHLMKHSFLLSPLVVNTLQLPLQLKQMENLMQAQPLQGPSAKSIGVSSKSFPSHPISCNPTTSSAPPMYLPLMKSLGGITLQPKIFHNSSLYSKCRETSLSWYVILKLLIKKRTVLQS